MSDYTMCNCGQLLDAKEGEMCATCKANGGKPRENRKLIVGRDGYPLGILDTTPVNAPRMDEDTYPYSEGEAPDSETLADDLPAYQPVHIESLPREPLAPRSQTQTGPALAPEQQAALDNYNPDFCYFTMTPKTECQCAWCRAIRLEAENAALKARVAELQHEHDFIGAMFERARELTYFSLAGEQFNRAWLNRLEQLYMQVAKFHPATTDRALVEIDHAEIDAQQADYNDAKNAGQGIYF